MSVQPSCRPGRPSVPRHRHSARRPDVPAGASASTNATVVLKLKPEPWRTTTVSPASGPPSDSSTGGKTAHAKVNTTGQERTKQRSALVQQTRRNAVHCRRQRELNKAVPRWSGGLVSDSNQNVAYKRKARRTKTDFKDHGRKNTAVEGSGTHQSTAAWRIVA